MKKLKTIILSAVIASFTVFGVASLTPSVVSAACTGTAAQCAGQGAGTANTGGNNLNQSIRIVVNMLLFLLGAISVIVIVIAGIKYVTSDGDASKIKSAKDTILYAVVGLIIALLAFAIVNWVISQFAAPPAGGQGQGQTP